MNSELNLVIIIMFLYVLLYSKNAKIKYGRWNYVIVITVKFLVSIFFLLQILKLSDISIQNVNFLDVHNFDADKFTEGMINEYFTLFRMILPLVIIIYFFVFITVKYLYNIFKSHNISKYAGIISFRSIVKMGFIKASKYAFVTTIAVLCSFFFYLNINIRAGIIATEISEQVENASINEEGYVSSTADETENKLTVEYEKTISSEFINTLNIMIFGILVPLLFATVSSFKKKEKVVEKLFLKEQTFELLTEASKQNEMTISEYIDIVLQKWSVNNLNLNRLKSISVEETSLNAISVSMLENLNYDKISEFKDDWHKQIKGQSKIDDTRSRIDKYKDSIRGERQKNNSSKILYIELSEKTYIKIIQFCNIFNIRIEDYIENMVLCEKYLETDTLQLRNIGPDEIQPLHVKIIDWIKNHNEIENDDAQNQTR